MKLNCYFANGVIFCQIFYFGSHPCPARTEKLLSAAIEKRASIMALPKEKFAGAYVKTLPLHAA